MKLLIHSVSLWGHGNIRTWEPADPGHFAELVFVDIGQKGKKGSDTFTIRVATPSGALIIVPASPRYSAGLKMLCFRGLCRFVAGRDGSFM